jgi:hypothetical protein
VHWQRFTVGARTAIIAICRNFKALLSLQTMTSQSSRKGKKAWRKNVDMAEVEQGLEGLRQEERVTGYTTVLSISFLIDKF